MRRRKGCAPVAKLRAPQTLLLGFCQFGSFAGQFLGEFSELGCSLKFGPLLDRIRDRRRHYPLKMRESTQMRLNPFFFEPNIISKI